MAYPEKRDGKLTGFWYGEKFVKDKRFRRRFQLKKDAEGYEVYVALMGTEPPTMENAQSSGRTFGDVAKQCKDAGGPKGKWKAGRDSSIIQRVDYVVAIIGHYDITAVNRRVMEQITTDLQKRPAMGKTHKLTNATINRYLNAAGAVLTYAVECEYLDSKPKVPLLHEVSKARGVLAGEDQDEAILRVLEERGHHVEAVCVRVLVETGLRSGELLERLSVSQITEDQNGNGWLHLTADQTKNYDARTVYIRAELARELRAIVAAGALPKHSKLLWDFKQAVKACGYPADIVIHSLRHTRNTRLRKQGVDMKIRMKMLGHKTTSASMRYDHVDTDDQLAAAKKVENARGNAPDRSEVVPFVRPLSA